MSEEKTAVLRCECRHDSQDRIYGKGKRLHNLLNNPKSDKRWRCTVCGSLR